MSECPACLRFDQDPRSYDLGSLDDRSTRLLELHHALIAELTTAIQGHSCGGQSIRGWTARPTGDRQ